MAALVRSLIFLILPLGETFAGGEFSFLSEGYLSATKLPFLGRMRNDLSLMRS